AAGFSVHDFETLRPQFRTDNCAGLTRSFQVTSCAAKPAMLAPVAATGIASAAAFAIAYRDLEARPGVAIWREETTAPASSLVHIGIRQIELLPNNLVHRVQTVKIKGNAGGLPFRPSAACNLRVRHWEANGIIHGGAATNETALQDVNRADAAVEEKLR